MKRILKNFIPILMFIILTVLIFPISVYANSGSFYIGWPTKTINGLTRPMDVAPFIENGRTYLPIRYVAEALGVEDENIIWDGNNQEVTLRTWNNVVNLKVGSNKLIFNNNEIIDMDVVPVIRDNRVFLPLRPIAETLNFNVYWDEAGQIITINDHNKDIKAEEEYVSIYKSFSELLIKSADICNQAAIKISQGFDPDDELEELFNTVNNMHKLYSSVSVPENHKKSAYYLDSCYTNLNLAILDLRMAISYKAIGNELQHFNHFESATNYFVEFSNDYVKSADSFLKEVS